MLAISLFGVIFLSIVWISYAVRFVIASLSGITFFDAGLTNVLLYVLFVCLPVFTLWGVFGYINQYLFNRSVSKQLFKLFSQIKKNQDYSDLLARIMLETEQNMKSSFMLGRFDLLVSDMNELLSEFLIRARLVSSEQIENLWAKVQNGGKWSFGKVIIENYNRQPSFQKRILAMATSDNLLAGTAMEFCARYQMLLGILEKHDKEKVFLNVLETGVLGKVFAIIAPVADEIKRSKEAIKSFDVKKDNFFEGGQTAGLSVHSQEKEGFFGRLKKKKKDTEKNIPQEDEFSKALARSFGEKSSSFTEQNDEPISQRTEPVFEPALEEVVSTPQESPSEEPLEELSDTQKALNSLKNEWSQIDTSAEDVKEDEELAYPFGGWTDAGNYQK